jgi:hypothetical protein
VKKPAKAPSAPKEADSGMKFETMAEEFEAMRALRDVLMSLTPEQRNRVLQATFIVLKIDPRAVWRFD